MTVAELRRLLEAFPPDAIVAVAISPVNCDHYEPVEGAGLVPVLVRNRWGGGVRYERAEEGIRPEVVVLGS